MLPWLSSGVAEPARLTLLYVTIAATLGTWLAGFAASMYGWWSHHAALKVVVDNKMLPPDLEAFLAHTEDRIITQRKPDGHAFVHRTLQTQLVRELAFV